MHRKHPRKSSHISPNSSGKSAKSSNASSPSSRRKGLGKYDLSDKKLTIVGFFNSGLLSILLCGLALWAMQKLETSQLGRVDSQSLHSSTPVLQSSSEHYPSNHNIYISNDGSSDEMRRWVKDKEYGIYGYKRKANGNGPDCIVFLTDNSWWDATLSAIYNVRDPSLGNWTDPIILMGNGISKKEKDLDIILKCMGVTYMDISQDKLKDTFWHLYFHKSYILLHDYFRKPWNKFSKVVYLDSDVFTVREWSKLLLRIKWRKQDYVAWREDYRHKSWYKAVLNLNKYDDRLKEELYRDYPDHPWAKQANVMIFDMLRLPSASELEKDMRVILKKYEKGFWRHDQSLFNMLFYHNSTELGFTAFNGPPEEKLFTPPDEYFPLVHTGHSEAMFQVGKKYHLLHLYYLHNIQQVCPHRHLFK